MAAAIVDLPTPPLPEPTAITFLMPGMSPVSAIPLPRTSAPMVILKVQSPGKPALQSGADVALDLGLERAGGRRQVDRQRHRAVADLDVLDHAQVDQVAAEVRVLDPFKASSTSRSVSVELVLPNIEPVSSAGGTTRVSRGDGRSWITTYSIRDGRKGPVVLIRRHRKRQCARLAGVGSPQLGSF